MVEMKIIQKWKLNRKMKKNNVSCIWTKDGKCHEFSLDCIIKECMRGL